MGVSRRGPLMVTLGAMYLSQGVVFGFASLVLVPHLSARGVSLAAQTGILALAGVPWVFKLGWALAVDRFRRFDLRRIVSGATIGVALASAWLATLVDTSQTADLALAWLVVNVLLTLQDVATDALALDALEPTDRGRANGVMLGSHHLGMEGVGGLALGAFVTAHGLAPALALQAGLVLVLSLVPVTVVQPRAPGGRAPREFSLAGQLPALVRPGAALLAAVLAAVVLFPDTATSAVAPHFLVAHLRWTPEDIASTLAPVLLVSNLSGYVVAAFVVDRFGHRRAATMASLLLGVAWMVFAGVEPWWTDRTFFFAFVVVQALITATLFVGVHALLMDVTDRRIRATHFAVLMSLLNLPRVYAPPVAAALVSAVGFAGLYALAGGAQAVLAVLIARVRPA